MALISGVAMSCAHAAGKAIVSVGTVAPIKQIETSQTRYEQAVDSSREGECLSCGREESDEVRKLRKGGEQAR